jgi:tRNA (guanine-N7-)-methyltransferase
MPRRALRKIDPALDLGRHFKTFDELPRPWNSEQVFGREAPLEVEVGSGKGLFLRSAAVERPLHNFLGIEVALKYARFAAAQLAKRDINNAAIVNADAQRLFAELLNDASLAAVHVYFPDPWWKKRHEKRRVMNESFIKNVERKLVPGGTLHYWTDVEERFNETVVLIGRASGLVGPLSVAEKHPEHDLDYRTHFERRMRLAAKPIFRAEFCKK